jgi:hypothetical protein
MSRSPCPTTTRRVRRLALAAVALLLAAPLARTARAQSNSGFATIAEQGIDFGQLVPGSTRTVLPTDPGAARWTITPVHPKGADIGNLRLTLPSGITRSGSTIALTYGSGMARLVNGDGQVVTFDPAVGLTNFLFRAPAKLYVGARATPATAQRAGAYTGGMTLVMTVP